MSAEAGWFPDPTGSHEMRYWSGSAWSEHVSDHGTQGVDPLPADTPPPPPPDAVAPPPPPPPAAAAAPPAAAAAPAAGRGGWKDRLKQVADQGKAMANQAKGAVAEQQAKRVEQLANDPNTLWFGSSKSAATNATGMSKAHYRITKDRIWIDTGLLGVKSEQVPLWAVRDVDVRQSVLQRGKDIGDVVLQLEDPMYSVDPTGALSMSGQAASEPGRTSGQVVLDNIEGPYQVRDLLMPLISDARSKKLIERQSQYLHVNPGMMAAGYGAAMAPPPAAAPPPSAPGSGAPPADLADQLRKLAELRDQGILSDEEFTAQKARLLGG